MSIDLAPNAKVTTGGDHPDDTEPHRTWYQLSESNAQLARRIADLEEDNADLRERLTKAMAQLRESERRQ